MGNKIEFPNDSMMPNAESLIQQAKEEKPIDPAFYGVNVNESGVIEFLDFDNDAQKTATRQYVVGLINCLATQGFFK